MALRGYRPPDEAISLDASIDALCHSKRSAGRNEKYIKGLGWSLRKFSKDFKNASVHEVSREEIESWLNEEDFELVTRRNYIRDLSILFRFALSRNWISDIPVAGIEKPAEVTGEILSSSPCLKPKPS